MHEGSGGRLLPKTAAAFVREPEWGADEWGNCFWGKNAENAVVHHQQHQAGYPTSGISTTPHFERALFYATEGGKHSVGYVYVIDTDRCREHGVSLYVVNDIVPQPSIPEDEEVILVASDFGALPPEIIIETRRCAV
jgi:hypothetical protein